MKLRYSPELTVWNSLPDSLRDPSVESERFRRYMETHLFAGHYIHERVIRSVSVSRNRAIQIAVYSLTYLLFHLLRHSCKIPFRGSLP